MDDDVAYLSRVPKLVDFSRDILKLFATTDPKDQSAKIYIGPGRMQAEVWNAMFLGDVALMDQFDDILLPTVFEKKDKCIGDVNVLTNMFRIIQRILFM